VNHLRALRVSHLRKCPFSRSLVLSYGSLLLSRRGYAFAGLLLFPPACCLGWLKRHLPRNGVLRWLSAAWTRPTGVRYVTLRIISKIPFVTEL